MPPVRSVGLWWVRRDLRLADNEALTGACQPASDAFLPVYCFDPRDIGPRREPPEGLGVPRLGPLRCRLVLEGLLELQRELQDLPQRQKQPPPPQQQQQQRHQQQEQQKQPGSPPQVVAAEATGEQSQRDPADATAAAASSSGSSSSNIWDTSAWGGGGGGRLLVRFGQPEDVLPALLTQVYDSNPELRHVSLHHHLDLMADSVRTERRVAEALAAWARQRGLSFSLHTYWDRTLYHPDDLPYHLYGGEGRKGAAAEQQRRLRSAQLGGPGAGATTSALQHQAFSQPPNCDPERFRPLPPVMTDFRKATQAASCVRTSLPKPSDLPPFPRPFCDQGGDGVAPAAARGGGDDVEVEEVEGREATESGDCVSRGEIPLTFEEVYDAVGATSALRRLEELVGLDYRTLLPPVDAGGDSAAAPDPRTAFPFRAGHENAVRRLRYYVWGHPEGPEGPESTGRQSRAPGGSPPSLLYFTNTRAQAVGVDSSTKLSPYVALGCITPRQIHEEVERVRVAAAAAATPSSAISTATRGSPLEAAEAHPTPPLAAGGGPPAGGKGAHPQGHGVTDRDGCTATAAAPAAAGAAPAAAPAATPGSSLAPPAECDWLAMHLCIRDFFIFTVLKEGEAIMDERGIVGRPVSWRRDHEAFRRWARGCTGLPFVDANMRELAATGWMSNRGRQNVASLLTKDLGIDWRWGAELFECLLLDADVAVNYCNWNYFAGIGNDPRNRHFKTVTQGIKYDEDATLAATWLSELARLPTGLRHQPWTMTEAEAVQYGVVLGRDYPEPMVDPANHVGQLGGKTGRKAGAKARR